MGKLSSVFQYIKVRLANNEKYIEMLRGGVLK